MKKILELAEFVCNNAKPITRIALDIDRLEKELIKRKTLEQTPITEAWLKEHGFVYVSEEESEYENEIAKKGYRLRRGGFERVKWNSTYIAEQYKLCLQKECKEPATIRNLIVHIGDMAVVRMNQIIDACNKAQAEKEKRTAKAKKEEKK